MTDFPPAPMLVPTQPLAGSRGLFGSNRQVLRDERINVVLSQMTRTRTISRDESRTALMHASLARR